MLTQWAKTAFLSGLGGVTGGTLTVECPDRTYRFGEPGELDATLTVHDERFFLRALTGTTSASASPSWTATGRRRSWCPWCG